jgi:hypothetical protein
MKVELLHIVFSQQIADLTISCPCPALKREYGARNRHDGPYSDLLFGV